MKGSPGFAAALRLLTRVLVAVPVPLGAPAEAQSRLTVILTGQSMIRSDLRARSGGARENAAAAAGRRRRLYQS
jgi:hypothetical protein